MCGVMILTIRAWIVKRIYGWIPVRRPRFRDVDFCIQSR
jgi:hypothetical protein